MPVSVLRKLRSAILGDIAEFNATVQGLVNPPPAPEGGLYTYRFELPEASRPRSLSLQPRVNERRDGFLLAARLP